MARDIIMHTEDRAVLLEEIKDRDPSTTGIFDKKDQMRKK
jgi:hypothetical protein